MNDMTPIDAAVQLYASAQVTASVVAFKAALYPMVSSLYEDMKSQAQSNAPISPAMLSATAAILAQVT